jgi:hypothetical protein
VGKLHIEMAIDNLLGKWLQGNEWTEMFSKASNSTSGRCDSLLKSYHVKRARYSHEVGLAALFILRKEAFKPCFQNSEETLQTFESWPSGSRCKEFLYWHTEMFEASESEISVCFY